MRERSHRIAGRPDFDALDAADVLPDAAAPARKEDGSVWVRWAKHGDYSGWFAVGSRKPQFLRTRSFWQAVLDVATACTGGALDQAHCCGPGILSIGGLGVTLRSGYAQLLLMCCLVENPPRYLETMAPVMKALGVFPKVDAQSPSGVALWEPGHRLISELTLREAVACGSDSSLWSRSAKARARIWVSCCSHLLRDERMDRAQIAFLREVSTSLLTENTRRAINWPKQGPDDWWQYTKHQQLLWALALVMALEDEHDTERLFVSARANTQAMDVATAEDVLKAAHVWIGDPDYAGVFQSRFAIALDRLTKLLEVT